MINADQVFSIIKLAAVAAGVAALAAFGSAIGADPVLNSDPTTAAIGGFIATIFARLALALSQAAAKPEPSPEVVPLSANISAGAAMNFPPAGSVLRKYAEHDPRNGGQSPGL